MGYQSYGIERELVQRMKKKLKDPFLKERVKFIAEGVTKDDLQDPVRVAALVRRTTKVLGEPLTERQLEQMVQFMLDQKIDPDNTFQLIKLWGMLR